VSLQKLITKKINFNLSIEPIHNIIKQLHTKFSIPSTKKIAPIQSLNQHQVKIPIVRKAICRVSSSILTVRTHSKLERSGARGP
jgi:DeoR/GlpR family transcriptional regulator of sugar metabolism